ncbi:hypothetical protein LTR97_011876 [Elasticomyces elasticus]|uniref:Uncharacterized protein n=1 Tax=Elasticomyces elasticus TaxID=574655 RepID=A0AAN7ZYH3_9PEZI|nr:hypothetical protein LTR97_011876 [Elasticomyces elasticus]
MRVKHAHHDVEVSDVLMLLLPVGIAHAAKSTPTHDVDIPDGPECDRCPTIRPTLHAPSTVYHGKNSMNLAAWETDRTVNGTTWTVSPSVSQAGGRHASPVLQEQDIIQNGPRVDGCPKTKPTLSTSGVTPDVAIPVARMVHASTAALPPSPP